MGCCVSTEENRAFKKQSSQHHYQQQYVSKSPPRPEEETVKEVLSETPHPKPIPIPEKTEQVKTEQVKTEQGNEEVPRKPILVKNPSFKRETHPCPHPCPCPGEEISDVSETTLSTSTLKDREDDELQSREPITVQGQKGQFDQRLRRFPSPVRRPDPLRRAEISGRRSSSPAKNRRAGNVGRSLSGRRTGPSPGRVRMVGPGPIPGPVKERRRESGDDWEGPNESLENPLVSLECFIFL